jgi:beta-glucosidase
VRELKGFQRIVVPGQSSRRVQFTIGPDHRRYWSTTARDWILDESVFDVYVGGDSTAELTATFDVHA